LNKKEEMTIFLTTQYLEEADRLCQRLCIVDGGKIVAQGSPAELKAEIGADAITITMKEAGAKSDEGTRSEARKILSTLQGISDVVDSGDGLTVYVKNGGYFVPDLVRAFDKSNIKLVSINLSTPSLDDVFLRHTGKRIRVEEELQKQAPTMFGRRR
jgi:ABC-2 type transport system ATP-binding protein